MKRNNKCQLYNFFIESVNVFELEKNRNCWIVLGMSWDGKYWKWCVSIWWLKRSGISGILTDFGIFFVSIEYCSNTYRLDSLKLQVHLYSFYYILLGTFIEWSEELTQFKMFSSYIHFLLHKRLIFLYW